MDHTLIQWIGFSDDNLTELEKKVDGALAKFGLDDNVELVHCWSAVPVSSQKKISYYDPFSESQQPSGAENNMIMQVFSEAGPNKFPFCDLDSGVRSAALLPIALVYDSKLQAVPDESIWMLPSTSTSGDIATFLQWRHAQPWLYTDARPRYEEIYRTYRPVLLQELQRLSSLAWLDGSPGPIAFVSAQSVYTKIHGVFTRCVGIHRLLAAHLLCCAELLCMRSLSLTYEDSDTTEKHPRSASKIYGQAVLSADLHEWLISIDDIVTGQNPVADYLYSNLDINQLKFSWAIGLSGKDFLDAILGEQPTPDSDISNAEATRCYLRSTMALCTQMLMQQDKCSAAADIIETGDSCSLLNQLIVLMGDFYKCNMQVWHKHSTLVCQVWSDFLASYLKIKFKDIFDSEFSRILSIIPNSGDHTQQVQLSVPQELLRAILHYDKTVAYSNRRMPWLCQKMPGKLGFYFSDDCLQQMDVEDIQCLYSGLDAGLLHESVIIQYSQSMQGLSSTSLECWKSHDDALRNSQFEASLIKVGLNEDVSDTLHGHIVALFFLRKQQGTSKFQIIQGVETLLVNNDVRNFESLVKSIVEMDSKLSHLKSDSGHWHMVLGAQRMSLAHHASFYGNLSCFRWLIKSCFQMFFSLSEYKNGYGQHGWSVVHSAIAGNKVMMLKELLCVFQVQNSWKEQVDSFSAVVQDFTDYLKSKWPSLCLSMLKEKDMSEAILACAELGVCSKQLDEWLPHLQKLGASDVQQGFDNVQSICKIEERDLVEAIFSDADKQNLVDAINKGAVAYAVHAVRCYQRSQFKNAEVISFLYNNDSALRSIATASMLTVLSRAIPDIEYAVMKMMTSVSDILKGILNHFNVLPVAIQANSTPPVRKAADEADQKIKTKAEKEMQWKMYSKTPRDSAECQMQDDSDYSGGTESGPKAKRSKTASCPPAVRPEDEIMSSPPSQSALSYSARASNYILRHPAIVMLTRTNIHEVLGCAALSMNMEGRVLRILKDNRVLTESGKVIRANHDQANGIGVPNAVETSCSSLFSGNPGEALGNNTDSGDEGEAHGYNTDPGGDDLEFKFRSRASDPGGQ